VILTELLFHFCMTSLTGLKPSTSRSEVWGSASTYEIDMSLNRCFSANQSGEIPLL